MSKSRALAYVVVGYALAVALAHLAPPLPRSFEGTFVGRVLDFLLMRVASADEEDRPIIIVRSGSIHIDDGDKTSQTPPWKPWEMASPPSFKLHLWKPNHPMGASVTGLEFTAVNVTNSAECPTTATTADSIDFSYSEAQVLNLSMMKNGSGKGGKFEPVITTTLDLADTPATGSAPDVLSYADGTLTGFTAHLGNTQVAKCTFASGSTSDERLRVRPLRQP